MDDMSFIDVVRELASSPEPSRELDQKIGLACGFHLPEGSRAWVSPDGIALTKLPRFSSSVNDAIWLCEYICPRQLIAISWEDGKASGRVGDGSIYQASGPAIALCIAVIVHVNTH